MLTDSEREWLKARNIAHPDGDYFCEHCDVFAECHMYWPIECPTKLSIKPEDIAFEARVAAKLADPYYPPMDVGSDGPRLFMPPVDRLKWARIDVEEEMNAD